MPDHFDADALADQLFPLLQSVDKPLLLTITTNEQCVVLGNKHMKQMDALQKAATYLHLNSVLVEELAVYEDEDERPYPPTP